MKGVVFYEEFTDESKLVSQGNVLAVNEESGTFTSDGIECYECLSAVYFHPDSAVATSAVSLEYLKKKCKEVTEEEARKVHPALFYRLDNNER